MSRHAIAVLVLAVVGCDSSPPGIVPLGGGGESEPDAGGEARTSRAAIFLDDFEGGGEIPTGWQLNGSPGTLVSMEPTTPPRAGSRFALHVIPVMTATGADVFTHHHVDWSRTFAGVRFWVRADDPSGAEVAVAVTGTVSETHDQALVAGRPWLMARVPARPEWAQVMVRFDKLMPEGPGTPQVTTDGGPMGVSELHFLAPDNGASGVWLDDIELLCGAGCPAAQ
jgi:hypothetical protein